MMQENVVDTYESRIIGGKVAYWKFKSGANEKSFESAFQEFKQMVNKPKIKRLVVSVEMDDPWSRKIQDLWIKTGEIANSAGIEKWGVYVPETNFKRPTIRFLMNGGSAGSRDYDKFISSDEQEVISWALN